MMYVKGKKIELGSRLYKTMVRNDHKLSGNDYVYGKISGIADAIFGGKKLTSWYSHKDDRTRYFEVYSSPLKYWLFRKKVEKIYPDLCDFDVDVTKSEEKKFE